MAGRKLFINNDGLRVIAGNLYSETRAEDRATHKDYRFQSIEECEEFIIKQLKLTTKMSKILSISIVEDGTIRIRTVDMFISNNETGILRKWYIGPWRIEVSPNCRIRWFPAKYEELGIRVGCWGGTKTVHPHISGNTHSACLGNAETPLQMYYHSGELKAFTIIALGFLESANLRDTAGSHLIACKEVELDEAGNVIVNEDGTYKYRTDTEVDREYHNCRGERNSYVYVSISRNGTVDLIHKEYLCGGHTFNCEACKGTFNMAYSKIVRDKYFCTDCAANIKQCDTCSTVVNNNNSITIGDKTYCNNCMKFLSKKCGTCGERILLKDEEFGTVSALLKLGKIIKTDRLFKDYEIISKDIINSTKAISYDKVGACVNKEYMCDKCKELLKTNETLQTTKGFKLDKVDCTEDLRIAVSPNIYTDTKYKCSMCSSLVDTSELIYVPNRNTYVCNKCAIYDIHTILNTYARRNTLEYLELFFKYNVVIVKSKTATKIEYHILKDATSETLSKLQSIFRYDYEDDIESTIPVGDILIVAKSKLVDKDFNGLEIERRRITNG